MIILEIREEKAGTALSFRYQLDHTTLEYLMAHCDNPAELACSMLKMIRSDDQRAHNEEEQNGTSLQETH